MFPNLHFLDFTQLEKDQLVRLDRENERGYSLLLGVNEGEIN